MKPTKNGTFSFNIVHEVIDHPCMNRFMFRIHMNKLLVNFCVDELEHT